MATMYWATRPTGSRGAVRGENSRSDLSVVGSAGGVTLRSGAGGAIKRPTSIYGRNSFYFDESDDGAATAATTTTITMKDTDGRIEDVRSVNLELFKGVNYSDAYYDLINDSAPFSQLAYVDGSAAGAVCCFVVVKQKHKKIKKEINISTIGVLRKFRRRGVGTKLMRHVISASREDSLVERVVLNVHSDDELAIRFYRKFGFQLVSFMKLPIGEALVMELRIRTMIL